MSRIFAALLILAAPVARAEDSPDDYPKVVKVNGKKCIQSLDEHGCVIQQCKTGEDLDEAMVVGALGVDPKTCMPGKKPTPVVQDDLVDAPSEAQRPKAPNLNYTMHSPYDALLIADATATQGWSVGFKVAAIVGVATGVVALVAGIANTGNSSSEPLVLSGIGGAALGGICAIVAGAIDGSARGTLEKALVAQYPPR